MQPDQPPEDDPQILEDEFAPADLAPDGNTPCYGVVVVEGIETGEEPVREFAPGSMDWVATPFSLKWQPAEADGHDGAVVAGRIDQMWRDGSLIRFVGAMDSAGVMGGEAERLIAGKFLSGISLMEDDTKLEDVEEIYSLDAPVDDEADPALPVEDNEQVAVEVETEEDGPIFDLIEPSQPLRKLVIHKGRIRSATILPEGAFVEAFIALGPSPFAPPAIEAAEPMVAAAVSPHETETSDGAWDGPANEKRLPSPMPVATAREAYAYLDDGAVVDGMITKDVSRFLHHEVSDGGEPGAANTKACQTGIGVLNGGRGGTTIPAADLAGVYEHLADHLRDAGLDPPPLESDASGAAAAERSSTVVTAAAYTITIPDLPPESWFDEPVESPPFGALHITAAGRVYGLLAPAGVAHRAFRAQGKHVTAPTRIDYSEFQNKPCLVASACGDVFRINAGVITFDCGHASPLDPRRQDPTWAMQHYDNSCSVAARVRVGENRHGTWVAGALVHGISSDAVERMMGCALSGDWQGGKLNAALLVPVEGFPAAATASVRVREDALVASSIPIRFDAPPAAPDYGGVFDLIASANGRDPDSRFAEFAAERFADYEVGR